HRTGQFQGRTEVTYRGQTAVQSVAEVPVVLDRPVVRRQRRDGRTTYQQERGEALTLRLIVCRVATAAGETLAVWYLLTNAPAEAPAATVAVWYYWRRRIESF